VQPAEVLQRIAFLLEAEGAQSYKPQAFRRAASSVGAVSASELARLHTLGQLQSLPGVGKTVETVIVQTLSGAEPTYLVDLDKRSATLGTGPVLALRESLRGDCHSHSDWSDGGTSIEEMARAAAALGHEYLALTDHSPRLTVAHGLSVDDLGRQLDVVAGLNLALAPFRLLSGTEVDILDDGALDYDDEVLSRLDVVVASVHSNLRMSSPDMTRRLARAVSNPHVDILGHCTGRLIGGRRRPQSTFDPEVVFAACQASGTAVEVNSRPERRDPPEELLRMAGLAGCRVCIDSDAHAPGQLSWLGLGCAQVVAAEIEPGAVVNTLPLDAFLAWTATHGRG
jgi:putative hydrolase